MVIAAAKEMPAYGWWKSFGVHVPDCNKLPVRAQVTSVSAFEILGQLLTSDT